MKAIVIDDYGGTDRLRLDERPDPVPAAGEILVRVRAAAVTPTELLWVPTWVTRDGAPRPLPVIPGHEFSGEVAAIVTGLVVVGAAVACCYCWCCSRGTGGSGEDPESGGRRGPPRGSWR